MTLHQKQKQKSTNKKRGERDVGANKRDVGPKKLNAGHGRGQEDGRVLVVVQPELVTRTLFQVPSYGLPTRCPVWT